MAWMGLRELGLLRTLFKRSRNADPNTGEPEEDRTSDSQTADGEVNIVLQEDRIRRALAKGNFDPENVETFRTLARQRNKPNDLVFLNRQLRQRGRLDLFSDTELAQAVAWSRRKRHAWAARAGSPIRIAMFHVRDWHALLCEMVGKLAGDQIILRTDNEEELVAARPDAVISSFIYPEAISRMRAQLPETFWLYLRHGIANKKNSIENAGPFDAVCVTGEYVADYFSNTGFFPKEDIWITGYPPLDDFIPAGDRAAGTRRTVLYAPTFNEYLSSARSFGPGLLDSILAAAPDIRLIVKLHPEILNIDPDCWERWKQACHDNRRVDFIKDRNIDVLTLYGEADILISDFSSAGFLFLATGRPIVLLTPEGASGEHERYDPDGIEWQWRNMAEDIRNMDDLTTVLRNILSGRDDHAAARAHYRNELFGDTLDGNSAARVMQRLQQVFGG